MNVINNEFLSNLWRNVAVYNISNILAHLSVHHCMFLYYTTLQLHNRLKGWFSSNNLHLNAVLKPFRTSGVATICCLFWSFLSRQYLGVPLSPPSCWGHTFPLNFNTGHNEILYHYMELHTFCRQSHGRLGSFFSLLPSCFSFLGPGW